MLGRTPSVRSVSARPRVSHAFVLTDAICRGVHKAYLHASLLTLDLNKAPSTTDAKPIPVSPIPREHAFYGIVHVDGYGEG